MHNIINFIFGVFTLIVMGMTFYLFYLMIKLLPKYSSFLKAYSDFVWTELLTPHKKFFIAFAVVFIIIMSLAMFVFVADDDSGNVPIPDAADGALSHTIEELTKKTIGAFNESAAMEKICANNLAIGRPSIALWTDNQRTVIVLTPDFEQIIHGPNVYFNGEGEIVLMIPERPVKAYDPEAEIWNKEVEGLLMGLKQTEKLSCQKIDPIMIP